MGARYLLTFADFIPADNITSRSMCTCILCKYIYIYINTYINRFLQMTLYDLYTLIYDQITYDLQCYMVRIQRHHASP